MPSSLLSSATAVQQSAAVAELLTQKMEPQTLPAHATRMRMVRTNPEAQLERQEKFEKFRQKIVARGGKLFENLTKFYESHKPSNRAILNQELSTILALHASSLAEDDKGELLHTLLEKGKAHIDGASVLRHCTEIAKVPLKQCTARARLSMVHSVFMHGSQRTSK